MRIPRKKQGIGRRRVEKDETNGEERKTMESFKLTKHRPIVSK